MRIIFDTNILISRLLLPNSDPAKAVQKGLHESQILVSNDTMMELAEVLSRKKFDRYVSIEDRQEFLRMLGRVIEKVHIIKIIRRSRDPKDDKFLELAVNGEADLLITGHQDLLELKFIQGTRIISVSEYLEDTKLE